MDGKKLLTCLLVALGVLFSAAGCAPASQDAVGNDEVAAAEGVLIEAPAEEVAEMVEPASVLSSDGDAALSGERGGGDIAADTGAGAAEAPGSIVPLPTSVANLPDSEFQAHLSAGEINDNVDFAEYLQYRTDYLRFVGAGSVRDRDVSERHVIRVTNRAGLPVLGAEVLVYQGQSLVATFRTPATGTAYFFPRAFAGVSDTPFTATIRKGQDTASITLSRGTADQEWPVTLNTNATQAPVQLDVLFLIDATGSMADEIDQLKENILSISAQIKALPSRPDVRFAMVTYRDRGDEYITRVTDFTADVNAFQAALRDVYAGGGGDTPESLNEALNKAISGVSWRVEDTVSLVFLVADAPPHLDYPQDFAYDDEMIRAAGLGIKILPISSELGDDYFQDQAEYIFRQLGLFTGGSFIFLTYDSMAQSDGDPGRDDVSVSEDRYTVEDLDALVIRLVQEELAALSGGQ